MGIAPAGIETRLKAAALLLGSVAALVAAHPTALHAQRAEFRTESGLYRPTRVSLKDGSLHLQQKVGLRFGARLTLTFSNRFDIVTGVSYIPGYAMLHGAGKQIELRTGSHQLSGATAARYWLRLPERVLSWEVHTGLGVGFGGQAAYEDLFETSTVTGVIGTMVRYEIGRIVRLQLQIQDRLFRVRFGPGDPPSNRSPIQVAFGLGLPFLEALH